MRLPRPFRRRRTALLPPPPALLVVPDEPAPEPLVPPEWVAFRIQYRTPRRPA